MTNIPISVDDLEPGQQVFLQTGIGDIIGEVTEVSLDEVFVQAGVGLFDLQRWDIHVAYLYKEDEVGIGEEPND